MTMADPRELLDTYADQLVNEDNYGEPITPGNTAPELVAALRAVLDLHKPEPATHFANKDDDRCGACRESEPIRKFTKVWKFDSLDVEYRMHEHPDPEPCCAACVGEDDSGGEPLTERVPWPCPTVQAITTALEEK
jgi:hypothetical protein